MNSNKYKIGKIDKINKIDKNLVCVCNKKE